MPDNSPSLEEILAALAATPSRLAALTAGLDPALLRTRPAPDEWSAVAVLAHMRACADMWGKAIMTILAEDRPTFRAVNPATWIKQSGLSRSGIRALVARFYRAAGRAPGRAGPVAARRLGTGGDRDRSGQGPGANGAILCRVAGAP